MELRGERVVLRPATEADVPVLAELQGQPSVARWWGPPDEEDVAGATGTTVLAITSTAQSWG